MGNRGGMPGDVLLLNSRPSSSAKNNLHSQQPPPALSRRISIYDFTEEIPRGLFVAVADIVMGFRRSPRTDATVKRCSFSNSWSSCVDNLTVAMLKCAAVKRNYALGIKRIVSSSSPSLHIRAIIYWSMTSGHQEDRIIITITPPASVHHHHHHS